MSKRRNNSIMPDKSSSRKIPGSSANALQKAQKRIARQAILALLTVVLTVVLIFAMTSAWYTNIVQSSGLTFQAEAWGFSGTIDLDVPKVIKAGPGDEGIIGLTVTNSEKTVTDINVNVNKSEMAEQMQQRLYFYADAQLTRNGETMERVYLNNRDNYTYTLFSNGTLRLSEELHNDALLKWQWVYDVLGYYVIGRYDAQTKQMTVEEYLRPIEYDYDDATTTFEKVTTLDDGTEIFSNVLSTVDGTTTVDAFLYDLSQKDGYAGQISTFVYAEVGRDKYYPVDAAGYKNGTYPDGYGIYAYLCNYSQIQQATEFDTALGQAAYQLDTTTTITDVEGITNANDLVSKAKLTISAQKSESTVISVTTTTGLKQAMAMKNVDVIQLNDDINLTDDPLVIPAGQRLMLDLNGNQITSIIETDAANKVAITAQPGSSLTILNGEIVGKLEKDLTQTETNPDGTTQPTEEEEQITSAGYAIYSTGAEVVLSDVEVKDFKYGIYVGDSDNDNTLDSRIYLTNSSIDVTSNAVIIAGNGYASSQKSQLIVEKSTLTSDGITISGNGTTAGNGRWGTDIQIIESTITSKASDDITKAGAGIYHPQKDSNLTIYNSKVSGYTGVALKGGTCTINNSTITGTGVQTMEPKFFTSGFADTADAVYIETNYGYDIRLTITGSSVLTTRNDNLEARSLRVYDSEALNFAVKIVSGIFDEVQPAAWIAEGSAADGTHVVVSSTTQTDTNDDPEAVS